jgi:hypothetical protein
VSKKELASWLEAPDTSRIHNNLQGQHHKGTGEWFFGTEKYLRWREMPSSILWIKGKRAPPSLFLILMPTPNFRCHSWDREERDMVSINIAVEASKVLISVQLQHR